MPLILQVITLKILGEPKGCNRNTIYYIKITLNTQPSLRCNRIVNLRVNQGTCIYLYDLEKFYTMHPNLKIKDPPGRSPGGGVTDPILF